MNTNTQKLVSAKKGCIDRPKTSAQESEIDLAQKKVTLHSPLLEREFLRKKKRKFFRKKKDI